MATPIVWQQGSSDPNNGHHLDLVSQWWESLHSQDIIWQQRLMPDSGNLEEITWESQRFDEKFPVQTPQIRGITLYWQKVGEIHEHSIIPKQLELDPDNQSLNIFPQSQPKLIIRISKPPQYKTVELEDPLIMGKEVGDRYILLIRDKQKKLELKIDLSSENMRQFLDNFSPI